MSTFASPPSSLLSGSSFHGGGLRSARSDRALCGAVNTPRARGVCAQAQAAPSAGTMGRTTAFRKYHGLGNDFILIDNRESRRPVLEAKEAVGVCARHTGVGADGVIFLLPPEHASSDCAMRIFNSDGTEPEMCGNGIRCLARFADYLGVRSANPGKYVVDTPAGVIVPQLVPGTPDVRVDMGPPIVRAEDIPVDVAGAVRVDEGKGFTAARIEADGKEWGVTCVSMGNPHCVTFVDRETYTYMDANLESKGPLFEHHALFPAHTNTEFVVQRSDTHFDMLVWERGAGRTMACGTGACAVLAAAVLTGRAKKDFPTTVSLPGGDLTIEWETESDHIYMTGPAELVFSGNLQ